MESDEEDALRQMVIRRLANQRRASDVTQEICEKTGLAWSEAEAFVREVAVMEEKTIRRRRSPALFGLGAVIFLGGLGLVAITISTVVNVITHYRATQPEIWGTVNILLFVANQAPLAFWVGALGLAMVMGSLIGMRDVWVDWLE
jgi:hypothetical protein